MRIHVAVAVEGDERKEWIHIEWCTIEWHGGQRTAITHILEYALIFFCFL